MNQSQAYQSQAYQSQMQAKKSNDIVSWIKNTIDIFENQLEKKVEELMYREKKDGPILPLNTANGERCLDYNLDTIDLTIKNTLTKSNSNLSDIKPISYDNSNDDYIIYFYTPKDFCDMV